MAGLLSRERIIAKPGFNRWLVPPAALAIHLSIGMAYGFSVFWLPLSRAIGITEPVPCPGGHELLRAADRHVCDWQISMLGWMYTLFFVFLGSSAAIFGRWLEHAGPRKAGVVAAFCWGGGFLISALGVHLHQIWLLWLGSGVIGGCGLGLGYISPVSTLIKWFPDRRGMATGMAIMGFGGGAMIGAPLADLLMKHYATPTSVGVVETFLTMGAIYFVAMLAGAFGYRIPPPDWTVAPRVPKHRALTTEHAAMRQRDDHHPPRARGPGVEDAAVLAPVGRPLPQRERGDRRDRHGLADDPGGLRRPADRPERRLAPRPERGPEGAARHDRRRVRGAAQPVQHRGPDRLGLAAPTISAGSAPTPSSSRWASALYAAAPFAGRIGSVALFVAIFCVILTMYGGGFATVPAYLADIFGTQFVGAIHGRLLTAWSAAGHPRSGAGELHPRVSDRAGRPGGPGLQRDDVRAGGACWSWASSATWRCGRSPSGTTCRTRSWSVSARSSGGRWRAPSDCIKSPRPEYCFSGAFQQETRTSRGGGTMPNEGESGPVREHLDPGGGRLAAGLGAPALGDLDHAGEGCGALPGDPTS